jgi:hypothetical protein
MEKIRIRDKNPESATLIFLDVIKRPRETLISSFGKIFALTARALTCLYSYMPENPKKPALVRSLSTRALNPAFRAHAFKSKCCWHKKKIRNRVQQYTFLILKF